MKETAKLPISEDSLFQLPSTGGGEPRPERHTPRPHGASAWGAPLPPAPSVHGRQTVRGNSPSLFYTLSPKASPAPTPPPCAPFCKYVKKDKTTNVGVLAGVSPPAVTFNYVIMYRESCWCSKTVWLCNFCTFAIRNIKDLFSYFKPDSPLHSAVSQEILQG